MTSIVENDWITKAGLRAVCLFVNDSHRCGYVEVPKGHPLYGVDYSEETPVLDFNPEEITIGKKGALFALTATANSATGGIRRSPDIAFDVHGGLTFSGGDGKYPVPSDGWWFGFDCAHAGDGTPNFRRLFGGRGGPVRSQAYVEAECERLAEQIAEMRYKEPSQ